MAVPGKWPLRKKMIAALIITGSGAALVDCVGNGQ